MNSGEFLIEGVWYLHDICDASAFLIGDLSEYDISRGMKLYRVFQQSCGRSPRGVWIE